MSTQLASISGITTARLTFAKKSRATSRRAVVVEAKKKSVGDLKEADVRVVDRVFARVFARVVLDETRATRAWDVIMM